MKEDNFTNDDTNKGNLVAKQTLISQFDSVHDADNRHQQICGARGRVSALDNC